MPKVVFDKISEIIKPDFINKFLGGEVKLMDSTSKPVKLKKTGVYLCIQPDKIIPKFDNNYPFFVNSIEGVCAVADNIVFFPIKETLYVFIIELKTNNTTGAINQVRAGFELSKYICATARRLLNYPSVDIQYRGLIFSSKCLIKGTTKPQRHKYDEDANNVELKFSHLRSGCDYNLNIYAV